LIQSHQNCICLSALGAQRGKVGDMWQEEIKNILGYVAEILEVAMFALLRVLLQGQDYLLTYKIRNYLYF